MPQTPHTREWHSTRVHAGIHWIPRMEADSRLDAWEKAFSSAQPEAARKAVEDGARAEIYRDSPTAAEAILTRDRIRVLSEHPDKWWHLSRQGFRYSTDRGPDTACRSLIDLADKMILEGL